MVAALLARAIGQPDTAAGALATLRAATDSVVKGGEYYGPDRFGGWSGQHPKVKRSSDRSYDSAVQHGLWAESERLTGVSYDFTCRH
jgi:hypothetical protein